MATSPKSVLEKALGMQPDVSILVESRRSGLRKTESVSPFRRWLLAWLGLLWISVSSTHADGCFVFRWNKDLDIKEPTQKAILVFDGGREELLLQVKYEGPLEEFGWLIPVPSLPEVERGSMEPFYELSRITQMDVRPDFRMMMRGGADAGGAESVRAIEVKTVGAYQVAVLSAKESGSLAAWLQSHDYSIPQAQSGVVEEYIRKGWYFVAVKIELNGEDSFRKGPGSEETHTTLSRQALRTARQLAEGELHPLLIRFSTPSCVFPLAISAVGGKPSEVSLYVLSTSPLLNNFLYQESLERYRKQMEAWDLEKERQYRSGAAKRSKTLWVHSQVVDWGLAERHVPRNPSTGRVERDWTGQDVIAMLEEEWPFLTQDAGWDERLEDWFRYPWFQLLHCRPISIEEMPQCLQQFPRLAEAAWYLTKQVRTFKPEEMRDLDFEPAIPVLARLLREPQGEAGLLTLLRPASNASLELARGSANSEERINAWKALFWPKDSGYVETVLGLLPDPSPRIRYETLRHIEDHWDARFRDAVFARLRDEYPEIRGKAALLLSKRDSGSQTDIYLSLFKGASLATQSLALSALSERNAALIPREELVSLLSSPRFELAMQAFDLLSPHPPGQQNLPSEEAARLATNVLARLRIIGLSLLRANADAAAVEIALSLTEDRNPIVRRRAFELLRHVTDKDFPDGDPAEWRRWWEANRKH